MKLILFDIDGTLLHLNGAGRLMVELVLEKLLDRPVDTSKISFSGKTDPQIALEVVTVAGVPQEDREAVAAATIERYTQFVADSIDELHVSMYPGVRNLVEMLSRRSDVQLGLLTGNVAPVAYFKLKAVGLDGFFPFGAFGSDNPDRYRLPEVAQRRAHEHTGRTFAGHEMVIVGDTEHDILCGRELGAFSVAVCTGRYSREELSRHGPDVLFDSFADPDLFIRNVLQ